MYEGNPRRLRRYRRSPASTSTLTLCGRRVATRTANTVRVLTLDGSSKRACMRHHSSLHVAHQLPTSPCSPVSNTRGGFAAGAGGFAALYPNCGKQKKLSSVYDMRHNFASRRISILHGLIAENARSTRLREQRWRDAVRRGGNAPTCDILAMLFGETAEARHLLGEQPAGAYDFLIRRHGHYSSSGIALTLLIISGRPVRWDGFNRSGSPGSL